MKTHKKRELATSFTTFLFLIIAITGIMMFFHILDKYTKTIHEFLGLAFVVIVFFHVLFNFKAMKKYFSQKVFYLSGTFVLLISLFFIFNTQDGPNPKRVVFDKVFNESSQKTFLLFSKNYEDAKSKLKNAGLKVEDNKSIKELAKLNKTSPFRIIDILNR